MISYSAFWDELEKVSFNLEEMKRVSQLSKLRQIRVPHGSVVATGGLRAVPKGSDKLVATALQGLRQSNQIPEASVAASLKLQKQTSGSIISPRRGGFLGLLHTPEASARGLPSPTNLPPAAKRAAEAVAKGHELDELSLGRRQISPAFGAAFGHVSPDVILRERNRLLTLPPGTEGAKDLFGAMRKGNEGSILELATRRAGAGSTPRLGLGYTSGPRLSRHARRHVAQRMEEITQSMLPPNIAGV
jgi:hypothetical protein